MKGYCSVDRTEPLMVLQEDIRVLSVFLAARKENV